MIVEVVESLQWFFNLQAVQWSAGIGLPAAAVALLVLELTRRLSISWWLVFVPVWGPVALLSLLAVLRIL